jgi:hypothetical protein
MHGFLPYLTACENQWLPCHPVDYDEESTKISECTSLIVMKEFLIIFFVNSLFIVPVFWIPGDVKQARATLFLGALCCHPGIGHRPLLSSFLSAPTTFCEEATSFSK